jgi:hypothetical protein
LTHNPKCGIIAYHNEKGGFTKMGEVGIFFKVGRVFGYKGVTLKVSKYKNDSPIYCEGCYFRDRENCNDVEVDCLGINRMDELDVIFEKVN